MTGQELFAALSAPFDPKKVSWRVGSTTQDKARGMALCYIDSRDVQDRFNEACGPFGWQAEHTVSADGKKFTCRIGVKDPDSGDWIWRSDGAGETDVEGEKGGYSDSLKRAAVSFGVGRYLYDIDSPWVELEAAGRSYKIKASEVGKLEAVLRGKAAPQAPMSSTAAAQGGGAKPPAREAPRGPNSPPDNEAVVWGRKALLTCNGFTKAEDFTAWYKPAIQSAISRLGEFDKTLQDSLVRAVCERQDALGIVPAGA